MIRRSTVVYIFLLLALVGAYTLLKNREKPAEVELTLAPTTVVSYLFTIEEGLPVGIRMEAKTGEIVEVERGADNAWKLIQPDEASADQGSAEAAASQISAMRVLDTIPSDVDPGLIGLEEPEYALTVKFANGEERLIDIGVLTPSESGYYVRDREAVDTILIVSNSAIDSLINLLRNPPYLETPTPLPETPMPEAGSGLEATATLQP